MKRKGVVNMLIPILRTDNHYDFVKEFILDSLLESKEIVKFKRINGWVTIGTDRVRAIKRTDASVETNRERRLSIQ
jgi:hypothetical protein